jgi:hypothetical protein
MSLLESVESPALETHPLDVVEELVLANDWLCQRADDNELAFEIAGSWSIYRLHFSWFDELCTLHFDCHLDVKPAHGSILQMGELLARINERLWVGHFGISSEDQSLVFRHTCLLRGHTHISAEVIEDLIELGIGEADRYYPAFQLALWGGKSADEAIAAAILDPIGEA